MSSAGSCVATQHAGRRQRPAPSIVDARKRRAAHRKNPDARKEMRRRSARAHPFD